MIPLWISDAIAAATGGIASEPFAVTGITFDSREVQPGDLFVALKGETSDGHRFAAQALAQGAAGLLVSEPTQGPHVRVADTLAGLEALGRAARARLSPEATIIGVTGSVGKTSVKEALRACLEAHGATHASVKSYNNHTGVPLSLARMPAATRWGVFEMGMNHRGEIAPLVRQVRPHVALVTWVGTAHIENLGSEAAIAQEKADVFTGLEPGGAAVIPFDNAWANALVDRARMVCERVITFGLAPGADVSATALDEAADGTAFVADVAGRTLALRLPRPGRHHVQNALAVLAAIHAAGADVAAGARILETLDVPPGRGRVLTLANGARVLDETYNANPDSMAAALATLDAMHCTGRKIAVLGAMRELGDHSEHFHTELGERVKAAGVAQAIIVDEGARPLADALPSAIFAADWRAALEIAREIIRPGDLLLVKGSNSIGLTNLVAALATPPEA